MITRKYRRTYRYVLRNQPVTAYDIEAKAELGFSLRPKKYYNSLGYTLNMLWYLGHLEAVKVGNKWNYYAVESK